MHKTENFIMDKTENFIMDKTENFIMDKTENLPLEKIPVWYIELNSMLYIYKIDNCPSALIALVYLAFKLIHHHRTNLKHTIANA